MPKSHSQQNLIPTNLSPPPIAPNLNGDGAVNTSGALEGGAIRNPPPVAAPRQLIRDPNAGPSRTPPRNNDSDNENTIQRPANHNTENHHQRQGSGKFSCFFWKLFGEKWTDDKILFLRTGELVFSPVLMYARVENCGVFGIFARKNGRATKYFLGRAMFFIARNCIRRALYSILIIFDP